MHRSRIACLHAAALRLRPHHNQSADRHQCAANPNPPNQRIERHANLGAFVLAHTGKNEVDILLKRAANSNFSRRLERRLSTTVDVLTLFARHHTRWFPIATDIQSDSCHLAVQSIVSRNALTDKSPLVTERIYDVA